MLARELKDGQIDEQLLVDEGGNVVHDRRWGWSVVIVCDCDGQCIEHFCQPSDKGGEFVLHLSKIEKY